MRIEDILKRDEKGNLTDSFPTILLKLEKDPITRDVEKWQKQYDGKHAILEKADKFKGEGVKREVVVLAKQVVTFQNKIVGSAVSFLFGAPVKLILNDGDEDTFGLITDVWDKSKLDYFNKKLARKTFIETKVAELWYVQKVKDRPGKIKVMLLCKKNGDEIYPHFNDYGDMDAFTRRYSQLDENGKVLPHIDIYMADIIINATKKSGKWEVVETENIFGKIPVIYYEQEKPEWDNVQTLIDRVEEMISKFADTNDYFGAPILKIKGEVTGAPIKEETGKIIQIIGETDDKGIKHYSGDAEYLVWEQAPESTKLEYDMLKDLIYSMTATPDLSFNNVKGLSGLSGIAIKLMFSDSILKAKDKEELFGENLIRRINLLKAILSVTDVKKKAMLEGLSISIEFSSPLPTDEEELIKSLSLARGGDPIMSEEAAVRQNPLVMDADEDIKKLGAEKDKMSNLGESFKV